MPGKNLMAHRLAAEGAVQRHHHEALPRVAARILLFGLRRAAATAGGHADAGQAAKAGPGALLGQVGRAAQLAALRVVMGRQFCSKLASQLLLRFHRAYMEA